METVNLKAALKTCQTLYDRNYAMLEKTQGTPARAYYIKQEQKLERQYTQIQQKLGEYIDDPCPTHTKTPCVECTGWYGKIPVWKSKHGIEVYHMVKPGNGIRCRVKS